MTLPIADHPSFHDQLPLGDYETLESVARAAACPGMLALEVGCWGGKGSVLLGGICKENGGTLVCVDWWKGTLSDAGRTLGMVADQIDVLAYWRCRIRDAGLRDNVIQMVGNSHEVLRTMDRACFDFIFIDADHAYDAVLQDIRDCLVLLKPGGTIAGHDYDAVFDERPKQWYWENRNADNADGIHCGVIVAVNELFGPGKFQFSHRIWWVKKEAAQ